MLILSRRPDERILIGATIVVTVLEVRGDRVKLGISAPGDVPVHRHEVHQRINPELRDEQAMRLVSQPFGNKDSPAAQGKDST